MGNIVAIDPRIEQRQTDRLPQCETENALDLCDLPDCVTTLVIDSTPQAFSECGSELPRGTNNRFSNCRGVMDHSYGLETGRASFHETPLFGWTGRLHRAFITDVDFHSCDPLSEAAERTFNFSLHSPSKHDLALDIVIGIELNLHEVNSNSGHYWAFRVNSRTGRWRKHKWTLNALGAAYFAGGIDVVVALGAEVDAGGKSGRNVKVVAEDHIKDGQPCGARQENWADKTWSRGEASLP